MSKAPAFQFYPSDYIRDTRILSIQARGAWCDLLCMMWFSEERGKYNGDITQLSRLWNTKKTLTKSILDELIICKICDAVTDGNGDITLISRRMYRDDKERKDNAIRQSRFKEKRKSNGKITGGNEKVTPLSSSSTSSSIKKEIYKERKNIPNGKTQTDFLEKLKSNPAYQHINIEMELSKMDAWLLLPKNKGRKKTPRFVLNWLNKIEAPIEPDKAMQTHFANEALSVDERWKRLQEKKT